MSVWINRDFSRLDSNLIKKFANISTGILSDCMNRMQSMEASIKPLDREWKICGSAFTIQSVEACNWGAHQALYLAKKGDVLVISTRSCIKAAVWGHIMTVVAKRIGLKGIVTDGCIRDAKENYADNFPIFSKGVCAAGPHKGWQCHINVPISCGGVPVSPGDIIVGDADGVVVVPSDKAEGVLKEAKERVLQEKDWHERIKKGESTLNLLKIKPI
jgi:regulator of RNase E activity RraA